MEVYWSYIISNENTMFSEVIYNENHYIGLNLDNNNKKLLYDDKFNYNGIIVNAEKINNLSLVLITKDDVILNFQVIKKISLFRKRNFIQYYSPEGFFNVLKIPDELVHLHTIFKPNTKLIIERHE